jgi:hypothetical protein
MEEQYKILQESDWNKGNESKMLPMDRIVMHNLWLQQMHDESRKQQEYVPTEPQQVVGFPD